MSFALSFLQNIMERKNENMCLYRLLLRFISVQFLHVLATKRLSRFWLCDLTQSVNVAHIETPIFYLLFLAFFYISCSKLRPPVCLLLRCYPLSLASDLPWNHNWNLIFMIWNFLWSQWETLVAIYFLLYSLLCTHPLSNLWKSLTSLSSGSL